MIPAPIKLAIKKIFGARARISSCGAVAGGTINQSFAVELVTGEKLFAKLKTPGNQTPGMFETEACCLKLIANSNTIRVPETLYVDPDCLIQTFFFEGNKDRRWHEEIGRQLALMHQSIRADKFGFELDNYLGTSIQLNTHSEDWLHFWRTNRLQPQISRLSALLGIDDKLIQQLDAFSAHLDSYLEGSQEPPVFVHGDLWSGNAAADELGAPIIFDPAGYFASREVELGMMRLFGGFGAKTEGAYQEVWPLEDGSEGRIEIYRLYHILNHLIIFGRSYYAAAMSSVRSLL